MPAPKHAKHFASAFVEMREVKLYTDNTIKGYWAVTVTDRPGVSTPYILIHPKVLEREEWFQEILVHEFVHVLEELYGYMIRKKNPKDCTQYAIVLGRYLPQLLRTFERVSDPAS